MIGTYSTCIAMQAKCIINPRRTRAARVAVHCYLVSREGQRAVQNIWISTVYNALLDTP